MRTMLLPPLSVAICTVNTQVCVPPPADWVIVAVMVLAMDVQPLAPFVENEPDVGTRRSQYEFPAPDVVGANQLRFPHESVIDGEPEPVLSPMVEPSEKKRMRGPLTPLPPKSVTVSVMGKLPGTTLLAE